MMSSAAGDLLWAQVSSFIFCTKDEYLMQFADFEVDEISSDGMLIGVVLRRGAEIHLAWKAGCSGTRKLLQQFLGSTIAAHGHAATTVPKNRKASQVFVERLGFEATHEDAFDIFYKIERMRHVHTGVL